MERSEDIEEKGEVNEPLLITTPSNGEEALKTLPFILAIDGVEKATYFGLQANMIMYLMGSYSLEMATASNLIFWWGAATNFAPVFCAFLADTYVGRFPMIGLGSIFTFMGLTLLWLTTMIPGIRPSCNDNLATKTCSSPTPFQLVFLCSSFSLMAIGAGGIRSSTTAFGADQIVGNGDNQGSGGLLGRFINWYCLSIYSSMMFAYAVLVYIQDHFGWKLGFGVTLLLVGIFTLFFFSGSSLYVKVKPQSSLFTGLVQVLFVSWRNRNCEEHPSQPCSEKLYHVVQGSKLKSPSERLRFLNKACLIQHPQEDLTLEGTAINPWHSCTVDQVEELKSILKILPIWSTNIMLPVISFQNSVQVLQANSMDRHFLIQTFEIPAGSFGTFGLLASIIWLILYDRVITPLASKAKKKPTILSIKNRLGASLILSIMSTMVAGVVESIRRERASPISAIWLLPQICLQALAESIGAVALVELLYSILPRSMYSMASSLYVLTYGIGNLVASLIMSIVDHITKQGGKESWISDDVNKGHYEYYYGVLASLSLLNYLYFWACSRSYWQEKKDSDDIKKGTSDQSLDANN